jgi:hypothetical protein
VCLEADKTASRGKTKAEICGENRRKRRKIRIGGNMNQDSGVFPQPVKALESPNKAGAAFIRQCEGKQPQPAWIDTLKMYCFCTAGMPIRAILAISEDVISATGEPLQLLIFPVLVAK